MSNDLLFRDIYPQDDQGDALGTQVKRKQVRSPRPSKTSVKAALKLIFDDRAFVFQTYGTKAHKSDLKPQFDCVKITSEVVKRLVRINGEGMNVGVVPNVLDGKGRGKGNVKEIRWLFADFDKGEHSVDSLMSLPARPTFIVETSPGKFHVYWRITGCSVAEFTSMQKAIAKKLGSDAAVSDRSRCMRLPGTLNVKCDPPYLSRIVFPEDGQKRGGRLDVAKFIETMGLNVDASKRGATAKLGADNLALTDAQIDGLLLTIDAIDYETWRTVGMALKSRYPGDLGLQKWNAYAARCPEQYDAERQREEWAAFKPDGGVTIGSLAHLAKPPHEEIEIPMDELELADALAKHGANSIRFGEASQSWWSFNGVTWEASKNSHGAMKYARDLLQSMSADAGGSPSARNMIRAGTLSAAVRLAQLDSKLHIDERLFDSDPELLGVKNGVVDLRTGAFRAARPTDYLTKQANVEYDPLAKCPKFARTLKAICRDRRDLRDFIVRAMGYTVTGLATEEKVFILMGKSGNGKGTLMGLMQSLLGSYAVSVAPNLLTAAYSNNPNASSSALMRLRGARMILCTELKAEKFDEAFFKQLSGGDALAGRDNYAQQTEFMPVGKVWLSANDDPDIAIEAEAMWRRILVLPFDASFISRMDTTLKARLAEEGPGVLNLMIKAAKAYLEAREEVEQVDGQQVTGLRESVSVADATSALRMRSDSVLSWETECCKKSKTGVLQSSIAYKSYCRSCKSNGKRALGQRAFKKALIDKGYPWKKTNEFNGFVGLRLTEAERK